MDEDEILTVCALRFDGWQYCEDVGWGDADRLSATDRLVNNLDIPAEVLHQFAMFFMLQRYLFKWGGETLPTNSYEWRAFRTLFLSEGV